MLAASIVLCWLMSIAATAAGTLQGTFIVLAPKFIREHSNVSVTISNVGHSGNAQFEITIDTITNGGSKKALKSTIAVQENKTGLVSFKTESLQKGSFKLKVRGIAGTNFNREVKIQTVKQSTVIFIQTDKPIYKPGDTLKFRVLVLDRETKPFAKLKSINVQIKDSKHHLINEWPYARLQHGVFQSQLGLANFIALGNWTITVTALAGETKRKSFGIAEYVLPKHDIRIRCPKLATFKDKSLNLVIDAMYTFGKPIKGRLSLSVEGSDARTQTEINGRVKTNVDIAEVISGRLNDEVLWIQMTALIEESESGQVYQAIEYIPVYTHSYKITLRKSSDYLLSEVPFKCWLTLTDPFGEPLDNPGTIKVESTQGSKSEVIERIPNARGVLALTFDQLQTTTKLDLTITYAGETTLFSIAHENERIESMVFLKASVLTERPKLNQLIEVQVHSSFKMRLLLFYVVAQGEVIIEGETVIADKRSGSFSFMSGFKMVPRASVVVFAPMNGELIRDVVHFELADLNNFVNVKLSTDKIEPNKQLTVTAESHPGSIVGLLAVDKSVLLLGGGNDITRKTLFEELQIFAVEGQTGDELEDIGIYVLTDAQTEPTMTKNNAFNSNIRFSDDIEENHIRKDFPESWLWTDLAPVNSKGKLIIEGVVPDSITSWSISAFAIHPEHGIGIVDAPISLTVLKPFFITLNLAYSIMKTEIALVEVFIFNYMVHAQETNVKLINAGGEFLFVDEQNQTNGALEQSQKKSVPAESVAKVTFLLKPKLPGDHVITVIAESGTIQDSVQQILKVTPGGLQYYRNIARFIEVEDSSHRFDMLKLIIPRMVTAGSENITFSVEGILLGAALTNLKGLIRLPAGCGEQIMLNLVPSVIALDYMTSTGTLNDSIQKTALDYLKRGYQNQLKNKLSDGSFSVFGSRDGQGSVFLTAFVAKTFRLAGKYITIDYNVVKKAYDWIRSQQGSDGKFSELGKIHHRGIQSGLSGGVTLTAYTLIAFLEHKNLAVQYRSVIDKGAQFISSKVNGLNKPYDLALVSYALQLAEHSNKQQPLDKLLELSESDTNRTMRWWHSGATSIETTAYALLTYMSRGMYVDAKPIMQWLVSQRYDKGGYDNTQNTFLGLQALAEYSRKLSSSRNNYAITVSYGKGQEQTMRVDGKSSMRSQLLSIPNHVRSVGVAITGTGTGVFQIAYQYNAVAADSEPRFEIVNSVRKDGSDSAIDLNVCSRFKPKTVHEVTNMVLMEILFPSGFIVSDKTLTRLKTVKEVRNIETKHDDTLLILYFDALPSEKSICVDIAGVRKAIVLGQIAGWIKVYDYYDPAREALEYITVDPTWS